MNIGQGLANKILNHDNLKDYMIEFFSRKNKIIFSGHSIIYDEDIIFDLAAKRDFSDQQLKDIEEAWIEANKEYFNKLKQDLTLTELTILIKQYDFISILETYDYTCSKKLLNHLENQIEYVIKMIKSNETINSIRGTACLVLSILYTRFCYDNELVNQDKLLDNLNILNNYKSTRSDVISDILKEAT